MKYTDALKEVRHQVHKGSNCCAMSISTQCYCAIIIALERRTPKLPDFEGDGFDDNGNIVFNTWICPTCNADYEVDYDDFKCCPNCGQALKWE